MSEQITTAFVNQYRANVELLLQQKGSIFRPLMRNEVQSAEFDYYDRIGAVTAVENTSRHGDTPLMTTPHDRRRLSLRDYDWADLIDKKDRIRLLMDPTSPYAVNASLAIGRAFDDAAITAFFDTAYSGKAGATSVPFPSGDIIAVDYVESGTAVNSGLTIAKLRKARTELAESLVDKDEPRFIALMAKQMQDLLQTTEITSSDYNTVKALVQGEVNTFMGFMFVETQRLNLDVAGGTERRLPCWSYTGMLAAIGAEMTAQITERADKRYSTQVYVSASFGFSRMEEGKVKQILCDEA